MIVAVFYGIVPITGAFLNRYRWRQFRERFKSLTLEPVLDYRQYRRLGSEGGVFRFIGRVESVAEGKTLWVRGGDLTIPVSLEKTQCWLLPFDEENEIPCMPEKIKWNRISTLTEGAKVFIGGLIKTQDDRLIFSSTNENHLTLIFYNCHETELAGRVIHASRSRNEYWNSITPVSLIIGAFALVYIAAYFLNRPAFRMTVISSLVAVFVPIIPAIPPGFLLTSVYRRLSWHARKLRAYCDLALLPLTFLKGGKENSILPTGETYGFIKTEPPQPVAEKEAPFLLPKTEKEKCADWHFFGVLENNEYLPKRSKDPLVSFGLLPGHPVTLARRYAIRAYAVEGLAWLIMMLGILVNVVFIMLIISLLGGL